MASDGAHPSSADRTCQKVLKTQLEKTHDLLRAIEATLQAELAKLDYSRETRLHNDLAEIASIIGNARVHEAATVFEAGALDLDDGFLISSEDEAARILAKVMPKVPVLIPKGLHRSRLPGRLIGEYLSFLRIFATLEAHYWDRPNDGETATFVPERLDSATVVDDFTSFRRGRVNLLDLPPLPHQGLPAFASSWNMGLLSIPNDRASCGKDHVDAHDTATKGAQFTICGNRGSFSLPHIDNEGKCTLVFCFSGVKLWFGWPPMDDDARKAWGRHDGPICPPCGKPFAIMQKAGDWLLLPPGYPHAAYNADDCLCAGFHLYHSEALMRSLEAMSYQLACPATSNEVVSNTAITKMRIFNDLWEASLSSPALSGPYSFGDTRGQQEFAELLRKVEMSQQGFATEVLRPAYPGGQKHSQKPKSSKSVTASKTTKPSAEPHTAADGGKPTTTGNDEAIVTETGITRPKRKLAEHCECREDRPCQMKGPKRCKCLAAKRQCNDDCRRHSGKIKPRGCLNMIGFEDTQHLVEKSRQDHKEAMEAWNAVNTASQPPQPAKSGQGLLSTGDTMEIDEDGGNLGQGGVEEGEEGEGEEEVESAEDDSVASGGSLEPFEDPLDDDFSELDASGQSEGESDSE